MDPRTNPLEQLFSRAGTPPQQQQQQQPQIQPQAQQSQPAPQSSPSQIDALFHQLTDPYPPPSSSVTSLLSLTEPPPAPDPQPSHALESQTTTAQNTLLSILGAGPPPAPIVGPPLQQQLPQSQAPTPPGPTLLEKLMGNPPRGQYTDPLPLPLALPAPSPPYAPSIHSVHEVEYRSYDPPSDPAPRPQEQLSQPQQPQQHTPQQQLSQPLPPSQPQSQSQSQPQPQQQPQQQTPSPRKSMFEFLSPFDHLSASSSAVKKKPVPPQAPSVSSVEDSSSWTAVTDPKRQSVENLLEHLSRQQAATTSQPQPPPPPAQTQTYEPFDFSHPEPVAASRVPPPPLPPKPLPNPNRTSSPRASPPKTQTQRTQGRTADSPASQQGAPASQAHVQVQSQAQIVQSQNQNRRDKDVSPVPRAGGGGGGRGSKFTNPGKFAKNQSSPAPPPQSIVFDVSQPLDEVQAVRDSVKSTPIALVKQDSVFLPGTTIGATHWVAYAMTRGRVRVISRSSGDRTLLQLPPLFPSNSSVIDMAVHGNRLAGVTSDGGFIIWELPETIHDDVPGTVLLCVTPAPDDSLHAVKWHPRDPDLLAVTSENKVYLIDLASPQYHQGQPITQTALHHLAQVFTTSSPVISFDFDVLRHALATISVDSTLTIWNIHDQVPYSTHSVRGEDIPSSITFIDGGIVVGRKNGTIYQLLSITTKHVLSTIKFINGSTEDPDMFGHASYDSRISTLWIANSRRESLVAFRINLESTVAGGEEAIRGGFDQVVEFGGQKPTIHFVILTADADPTGEEAHAACIAAKVPPGEVALVAFSVHAGGVDQLLIRKDWFDSAFLSAQAKFPMYDVAPLVSGVVASSSFDTKPQRHGALVPSSSMPVQHQQPVDLPLPPPAQRVRTPPTDDVEGEYSRDDNRGVEPKGKGNKGKNVNWKEKEERERERAAKSDAAILSDSALGQVFTREIKKTEENLHSRLGRLIGKEMEKQHQRLEDARAHEQVEDFARQEKILKLISTELTRNTTRVVEMAVKNEVQNSVLPSLENITKNEVRNAFNDQLGRGLGDYISQSLPGELEKLLFRPDISAHFAHTLSTTLTPLLGGHVHEALSKTFMPMYTQQLNRLHSELSQELRHEVHGLKTELMSWQRDLFRNQEASIRELEHNVRTLSDHIKYLSLNSAGPSFNLPQAPNRSSPGTSGMPQVQPGMAPLHARQQNPQAPVGVPTNYKIAPMQPLQPTPPQQIQQQQLPLQQQQPHTWYQPPLAAPQASHPATIPQPPPQAPPPPQQSQQQVQPQVQVPIQTQDVKSSPDTTDTWESLFLPAVLSEDLRDLQRLLARVNADIVMPLDVAGPLSQPVILTAMHRLAAIVCASPPNDESFRNAMWWLQRGISVLDPKEQIVMEYLPNVVPGIFTHLNLTKQRLGLPGGGPAIDKARASVNEAIAMLRRKGLQGYEGMDVQKK